MLNKLVPKHDKPISLFDLPFGTMLNKLVPKFSNFESKLPIDFDTMSNKFAQNLDSTCLQITIIVCHKLLLKSIAF